MYWLNFSLLCTQKFASCLLITSVSNANIFVSAEESWKSQELPLSADSYGKFYISYGCCRWEVKVMPYL